MKDNQCLALYEEATGESIHELSDQERRLAIDTVRGVRKATSAEEALSAVLWIGHSQDESVRLVEKLLK